MFDAVTYAAAVNSSKKEMNKIVDGAPEAFDTLKEVSDWIEKNNKQTDWNQNDETAVDYIKNKPQIKQDIGQSAEDLMSQKAITDAIKDQKIVYRGSDEPTDKSIEIWIDPTGSPAENYATQEYVDNAIGNVLKEAF